MILIGAFFLKSVVNSISLPLLLKVGFKKAKAITSMMPVFIAVELLFLLRNTGEETLMFLENETSLLYNVGDSFFLPLLVLLIWCLIVFASYMLSSKFYSQRDF